MAKDSMHLTRAIRNTLEQADGGDTVREMLRLTAQALMDAEADAVCGAEYGTRSPERTNRRNGYRQRGWDTRLGSIELAIPKLRKGTYYPEWLLEPRRRSERALASVVAESYVLGVSTRRVDRLVQALGLSGISKSQVSEIAQSLDETVADFRNRPLDAEAYPFLWLDGMVVKSREGGRIVPVCVVVAIGCNHDGRREILGVDVTTTEDGAGWLAFLRGLVSRGLKGVVHVTSDAHPGLKDAILSTFPGAAWQRCRTHFLGNLLTRIPKSAQNFVATAVRSIFAQTDLDSVQQQHAQVVDQLASRFPDAAEMLDEAKAEILAFAACPKELWKQIWSNNPLERLNKEIRRRTDVVGIFPNRAAIVRLVGAVLAEQNDEWAESRRYMSLDALNQARALQRQQPDQEEQQLLSA